MQLPEGYSLRVVTSSGDITVIAEKRDDIEVPEDAHIETRSGEEQPQERRRERRHGRHRKKGPFRFLKRLVKEAVKGELLYGRTPGPVLEVRSSRGGSRDIVVRCPVGTPVSVGSISGDVDLKGELGQATVTTTSGDVQVEAASALDVRSVSGDLEVVACGGLCRLHTKSGDIQAGSTGPAEATTISGQVQLGRTSGGVSVSSVSGGVEVGTGRHGHRQDTHRLRPGDRHHPARAAPRRPPPLLHRRRGMRVPARL